MHGKDELPSQTNATVCIHVQQSSYKTQMQRFKNDRVTALNSKSWSYLYLSPGIKCLGCKGVTHFMLHPNLRKPKPHGSV